MSFGVGALPSASPAACQTPKGGPDSINFNEALRNRPEVPEEFRDLVVVASVATVFNGSMGESMGLGGSFSVLFAMVNMWKSRPRKALDKYCTV